MRLKTVNVRLNAFQIGILDGIIMTHAHHHKLDLILVRNIQSIQKEFYRALNQKLSK